MTAKNDISTEDIKLLEYFYSQVQTDDFIGPIFNEKIGNRWPEHLEKMYRFWQTILLEVYVFWKSFSASQITRCQRTF
jgi:hemoglobin